ncbi:hypothetical protein BC835DRAFT_1305183 [Cytidiella melzeri]|nr:hypothetical protein BC835DRAFT_1305183 [Cytidiella melzeri]
MTDVDYSHQDFEIVRTDKRFGGFEEVKLKDGSTHTRFFRKAVTPGDVSELDKVYALFSYNSADFNSTFVISSELEAYIMKDGLSGAVHPIYEHGGRKWILLSVPEEHFHKTGLAA